MPLSVQDRFDPMIRWFLFDLSTFPANDVNGASVAGELSRLGLVGQTTMLVDNGILYALGRTHRRQYLNGKIRLFGQDSRPVADFVPGPSGWRFQALA